MDTRLLVTINARQQVAAAARQRVAAARGQVRSAHVPLHRARVTRVTVARLVGPATATRLVGPTTALARRVMVAAKPAVDRAAPVLRRPARRLVLAAAALGCLGLAAAAQGTFGGDSGLGSAAPTAVRDAAYQASRSGERVSMSAGSSTGVYDARTRLDESRADARAAEEAKAAVDAEAAAKAKADAEAKAAAAAKAAADAKWKADNPTPVAGLTQVQMNNALRIVGEGKALGLPKRAYVLAVACAMQESNLRNLASDVLPESYNYPHEGAGSDHDSVGLFQQRPSSGWGSIKDLMTPAYAAKQFYDALVSIPGWDSMALTYAIQAVQVSAFPDAYAKHADAAQAVVDALT